MKGGVMRRRHFQFILLAMVMVMLTACATFQEAWDKATPSEKAQFTIGKYQKTMIATLEAGNAFVTQNPKYKEDYQKKVIPLVKIVQSILNDFVTKGAKGEPFTFTDVEAAVSAKSKEILDLLLNWGVKPK
jgi:hypothetical protein